MNLSHYSYRTTPQKEWSENLAGGNMLQEGKGRWESSPPNAKTQTISGSQSRECTAPARQPFPDSKDSGIIHQEDTQSLGSLLNLSVHHKPVKKLSRQLREAPADFDRYSHNQPWSYFQLCNHHEVGGGRFSPPPLLDLYFITRVFMLNCLGKRNLQGFCVRKTWPWILI